MTTNKPQTSGLKRIINAAGYSSKGLRAAWQNEQAFRQEIYGCLILIPLGLWLGESGLERGLLVFAVMLVPLVELINSAIEAVVDRIGSEPHVLSGRAKDIGSAAVMLSIMMLVVIWLSVLL